MALAEIEAAKAERATGPLFRDFAARYRERRRRPAASTASSGYERATGPAGAPTMEHGRAGVRRVWAYINMSCR